MSVLEKEVIENDALPDADEGGSGDVLVSDVVDEGAQAKAYANSEDAVHPHACGRESDGRVGRGVVNEGEGGKGGQV